MVPRLPGSCTRSRASVSRPSREAGVEGLGLGNLESRDDVGGEGQRGHLDQVGAAALVDVGAVGLRPELMGGKPVGCGGHVAQTEGTERVEHAFGAFGGEETAPAAPLGGGQRGGELAQGIGGG